MLFLENFEQSESQKLEKEVSPEEIRAFIDRTQKRVDEALKQLEKEERYGVLNVEIIESGF